MYTPHWCHYSTWGRIFQNILVNSVHFKLLHGVFLFCSISILFCNKVHDVLIQSWHLSFVLISVWIELFKFLSLVFFSGAMQYWKLFLNRSAVSLLKQEAIILVIATVLCNGESSFLGSWSVGSCCRGHWSNFQGLCVHVCVCVCVCGGGGVALLGLGYSGLEIGKIISHISLWRWCFSEVWSQFCRGLPLSTFKYPLTSSYLNVCISSGGWQT